MTRQAVIIDAIRSPMGRGKVGGMLSDIHPSELLASIFRGLVERSGIDPATVDDLLIGCVSQVGEQAGMPGRQAWLAAGYPETVPAVMIDRRCGSGQQAIHFAAQGVKAGAYDIVIAGGVESMSRVPLGSARFGKDVYGPSVNARYAPGLTGQGISAELIAKRWSLSRDDMDKYSARSHERASAARDGGRFVNEIVPIFANDREISSDETIRPGTTADALGQLRPSFDDAESRVRFPDVDWKITAGNSSQLTDGAAALLIMSEEKAIELGLAPRARFVAFDVCGDDPLLMLTAPIPATTRVLKKAGLSLNDLDHVEVNEAFASVPLAWLKEHRIDPSLLNPVGGAIALGHPLGASGARLMTTMLGTLEHNKGRYGLQTMCEGFGMANATIIERL
jgi:acetyl-CoA acyltransferase